MNEEIKNNARCPLCGCDFYIDIQSGKATCPSCGKEISAIQALKYYQSVTESPEIAKEAHGEDYHTVRRLLDEARDLCLLSRFDEAEQKVNEALTLSESDYRVYMAMVEVKTKNYTDLKDESHKPFIDKAISVADAEERAEIKRAYKNYYEKRRFTSEELNKYAEETRKDKHNKLENDLKKLIPLYMTTDKQSPLYLTLTLVLFAAGIGLVVAAVVTEILWLSIFGIVATFAGYMFFRVWFNNKEQSRAFNAVLDLYDELDKLNLDDERAVSVYKKMSVLAEKFEEKAPVAAMSDAFGELINEIIAIDDDSLNEFMLNNKFFGKMVETE